MTIAFREVCPILLDFVEGASQNSGRRCEKTSEILVVAYRDEY